jgi:hypothetical protein
MMREARGGFGGIPARGTGIAWSFYKAFYPALYIPFIEPCQHACLGERYKLMLVNGHEQSHVKQFTAKSL